MQHYAKTTENCATNSARFERSITRAVALAFGISIVTAAILVTVLDAMPIVQPLQVDRGHPCTQC